MEAPVMSSDMASSSVKHTSATSGTEDDDLSALNASNAGALTKHERVKAFITRTKVKVKETMHSTPSSTSTKQAPEEDDEDEDDDEDLFADPAFSLEHIVKELSKDDRNAHEKIGDGLKTVRNAIVHPKSTIQSQVTKTAAGQISTNPKTFVTTDNDHDLVDAHDALANARSRHGVDDHAEVQTAREKVEQLEAQRASLRTAWSLGRHTDRVRVVHRNGPMPKREAYVRRDPLDGRAKFDRNMWLIALIEWYTQGFTAHHIEDVRYSDDLPFDIQDLSRIIEQLAMVSAPWQAFLIDVRKIYIWEDPKRTLKWLILFWTLWYTEHVVGYFYFYVIYATIRNRYWPTSVESVRDSLNRGVDREAQAQAWGELIQRHGGDDWIEPLLDDIGPLLQLQAADLANFMEILANFYRWERPKKTAATLLFFVACLLISLFTNMRYCVKILWFLVGGGFFFTFPIATRFPMYRFVVNPVCWVFWEIPTHAEMGIVQLQEKALIRDAELIKQEEDDFSDLADLDSPPSAAGRHQQYRFRASSDGSSGLLQVNRHSGIRFRSKEGETTIPFSSLRELQKWDTQSKKEKVFHPKASLLVFLYRDGTDADSILRLPLKLEKNQRHQVFTLVVAWSNLKWQVLPMNRNQETKEGESNVERSVKRVLM